MGGSQGEHQFVLLALDLPVGNNSWTEVGYCRTEDGCITACKLMGGSLVHLLAAFHIDASDVVVALQRHGACYQRDVGASLSAFLGKGESHLAR